MADNNMVARGFWEHQAMFDRVFALRGPIEQPIEQPKPPEPSRLVLGAQVAEYVAGLRHRYPRAAQHIASLMARPADEASNILDALEAAGGG